MISSSSLRTVLVGSALLALAACGEIKSFPDASEHDAMTIDGGTVDAIPDATPDATPIGCLTVPGHKYQSVELQVCGRGGFMCHFSLDLGSSQADTFTWIQGDIAWQGNFDCSGTTITAHPTGGADIVAPIDPTNGHITWDGLIYELVPDDGGT
jgi:hypothetical protein